MSVGIAYVLDLDGTFATKCNTSMVDLEPVLSEGEQQGKVSRDLWHMNHSDEAILKRLIENHAKYTDSKRAKELLADWAGYRAKFVKVFPKEYRRAMAENAAASRKAVA